MPRRKREGPASVSDTSPLAGATTEELMAYGLLNAQVAEETIEDISGMYEKVLDEGKGSMPAREAFGGQGEHPATVRHRPTGRSVPCYDRYGFVSWVPPQNLTQVLGRGMFLRCPLCGGHHLEDKGNDCPNRAKRKFTVCPICAAHGRERRIWDDLPGTLDGIQKSSVEEGDKEFVSFFSDSFATPEQRIRGKLVAHIQAKHSQEAQAMNLAPPTPGQGTGPAGVPEQVTGGMP